MSRLVLDPLVGRTITAVEAQAKHLLMSFDGDVVLHTHMGMTGAWHVYTAGERWRKPGYQARLVLEAADHQAVGFNVPRAELLAGRHLDRHPVLAGLGPDVLAGAVDLDEVARRAALLPATVPIGDVLLDQRVVSGIGNIYRCESLFLARLHPATPLSVAGPDGLLESVQQASRLMRARLGVTRGLAGPWVYGRHGRPCRRCGAPVATGQQGRHGRRVWWCPSCQPAPE